MTGYMPTTDEVAYAYADRKDFEDQVAHVERRGDAIALVEFHRWLAEHDRAVADAAWWEGVNDQWKHRPGVRLLPTRSPYRREVTS